MVPLKNSTKDLKNYHQVYTISSRKQKMRDHFSTQFKKPILLWYQNQTKTVEKQYYQPTPLTNLATKILKNILANWIQQYRKRIMYHEELWYSRYTKLVQYLNNRLMQSIYIQAKEKKPYQLMQKKKKAFDKIQHLFMTNSQQVRRGDKLPQFDKVYLQKI